MGVFLFVQITLYATSSITVRVLIDEKMRRDTAPWCITSKTGFLLYDPKKPDRKWRSAQETIRVQYKNNQLVLNGKTYPTTALQIVPQDGYATINNQQYHGNFSILTHENQLLLINHVDLEEYVHAVLKTESWPGWPVEVNKVFAIVSRSYVLAMINNTNGNQPPYHVKNTNEHQTYKGMHEVRTIRGAIKQTRGQILLHDNQPALTMFDSCCGGIVPAQIKDFDFEKAPYLAREYACTHCERCWIYSWNKTIPLEEFQRQVAHLFDIPGRAANAIITQHDGAGLVQEVELRNLRSRKRVSGKQFYNAFKEIKSFCFSIKRNGDTVALNGKGFGHHLGLCQWGAREMVRDGWNYRRILSFYYPDTQIGKLTNGKGGSSNAKL